MKVKNPGIVILFRDEAASVQPSESMMDDVGKQWLPPPSDRVTRPEDQNVHDCDQVTGLREERTGPKAQECGNQSSLGA